MYKYKFTIITAVYNVEQFLDECIESVLKQDIGFEKNVQFILVDDGSTDRSGEICDKYAKQYPNNILVIHKENGGAASARNEGLKYTNGEYINFLDSDDKFSENVLSEVERFFYKSGVGIVTIPVYFFDASSGEHWQNFKFKKGKRIINLANEFEAPLMFTNSSFYKAQYKDKILFDNRLVHGEDLKVNLTILSYEMKFGVINTCKYCYRRRNNGTQSLIQSSKKKKERYIDYLDYLVEWCFEFYNNKMGYIPPFVQYTIMCDLQWRLIENINIREILSENEEKKYIDKLSKSFMYIDDEYILKQKKLNSEHKYYALKKKYELVYQNDKIKLKNIIKKIENIFKCVTNLEFINIKNNSIILELTNTYLGNFNQINKNVCLLVNGKKIICEPNYKRVNEIKCLNEPIAYRITFKGIIKDIENIKRLEILFCDELQGNFNKREKIVTGKFFPIDKNLKKSYAIIENYILFLSENKLIIERYRFLDFLKKECIFLKEIFSIKNPAAKKAFFSRCLYHFIKPFFKKEIWLISDRINKADDNGQALFEYINNNKLPINTYFVLSKNSADYSNISKVGKVLSYLSWKHKFYHLLADKIISSAADDYVYNPFFGNNKFYKDIFNKQKYVFLQHGIIQNDLTNWLNRYNKNLSLFITTALPEYNAILNKDYFYDKNVVKILGLCRHDYLYEETQKIITIMPTWRSYIVTNNTYAVDGIKRYDRSFLETSYFKFYNKLINNNKLIKAAESYGYKIKFMPHPNVINYIDFFHKNKNIEFCNISTKYSEIFNTSALIVTDYSSVAFDFAYLRKPIIYTQFDKDEFFEKHICEHGYFDYERDGFGEVEYDIDSTINRIIEYVENDCKLKDKYKERTKRFFAFNDHNNCKRVYEAIKSLK